MSTIQETDTIQPVATMTIARAMTRIDTIIAQCKRIEEEIGKYGAWCNKERLPIADQKVALDKNHNQAGSYVRTQYQKHKDLITQLMKLKGAVNRANLENSFTIGDKTFSISDWLFYKKEVKSRIQSINSQYTGAVSKAEMKVRQYNSNLSSMNVPDMDRETMFADVIYFVPKEELESQAAFLNEFLVEINGRLNEVNNQVQLTI